MYLLFQNRTNKKLHINIDRLDKIAPTCKVSRSRFVDSGDIVTGAEIAAGIEIEFHLLRKADYDEDFLSGIARIMEYKETYDLYRDDIEYDKQKYKHSIIQMLSSI